MKLEKNKIVFVGFLLAIVIFIVLYAISLGKETEEPELKQPKVPELKDMPEEYGSKLEAVDDIKEQRETPKPSLYGEGHIDSTGTYDPLLEEKERQRIVDSIYREGRIDYGQGTYRKSKQVVVEKETASQATPDAPPKQEPELVYFLEAYRTFFAHNTRNVNTNPPMVVAVVNGEQMVRSKNRLELRLREAVDLNGRHFKRNTLLYGFVSFRANRVFVTIDHIGQHPVNLKVYDLLDGGEGIYVEHSYREEATREVLDDAVQDMNLPGVPQVSGIKQVFRRSNRTVKVTIHDQYQLILKP
ncbi:conjugative transposon protein TraM [Muricauda oceani]|uniref:Conjugative transposon protein TraM n=1 Tax=Flagellimonas oceani TaxID=2698672 RepID=A0A6G7J0Y5_9FLAO|nr:conjugative transposon protein TraM [Allomuricauda oceani]MBW8244238.1 conjugative transposon protein TraM [Allomuricauda oceani]QII44112.1 conjugative transposon protein TraM [Allomuricauda oceani]